MSIAGRLTLLGVPPSEAVFSREKLFTAKMMGNFGLNTRYIIVPSYGSRSFILPIAIVIHFIPDINPILYAGGKFSFGYVNGDEVCSITNTNIFGSNSKIIYVPTISTNIRYGSTTVVGEPFEMWSDSEYDTSNSSQAELRVWCSYRVIKYF